MKSFASSIALVCAPFASFAEEVTIAVFDGEATLEAAPETVVAFDLAAIDTLDALGVKVDGVPAFGPPAFLVGAMGDVDTMGTLFEPDFEKLAVLGPDLIIAGGRSQAAIEGLSEVATTIDMTLRGADLLADSRARIEAYGTLFNKQDEAAEVIGTIEAKLEAVNTAVEGKGGALILMTNGGKLSAYGDDSRFGWLHTATGIPEAFAEITAENHGESVSFEFIADVNPDWILVIDRLSAIGREGEAAAVTLDNPLVAGTTAGQNGQIIYLDSAPLYLAAGGANALQIILDQLIDDFGG
ncbi:siderophore ABC transporter substrate-binding protein [Loktanella sp. S4079]|uniref:siderophore ABC transporter substrate-binding protein n=1 Tax=Loktanella sp. S4079 TaxID=579483 RepID=UPI0005FA5F27|nr:siderophore ABC transporter substrate-binding protein [Loktanella sp. S4079]KJZ20234.1 iron ABC transporter substrate-binding protein [Loktanella sp. S4079]